MILDKKYSSFIIFTPNILALFAFEPALSPITKKSVFLVIVLNIFAPFFFTRYFASSLERFFNVPVKTMFLFVK